MNMTSWEELGEFEFVDLEETDVLDWNVFDGDFVIKLDACILEGHQMYTPDERYDGMCFNEAVLKFSDVSALDGLLDKVNVHEVENSVEGNTTYGALNYLETDGRNFHLSSPFGDVSFAAGGWAFLVSSKKK